MASVEIMPKVGISVESCIITKWLKEIGDTVSVGEALFSCETDKISLDVESKSAGMVLVRFAEEGDDVPCLTPVCVIGEKGENIEGLCHDMEPAAGASQPVDTADSSISSPVSAPADSGCTVKEFVAASPRAKKFAQDNSVDISKVAHTGANNRIIERDVRAYVAAGVDNTGENANEIPAEAVMDYTDTKMSSIRKAIAKSMTLSVTTIPQVTHNISFDVANISEYRKTLKAGAETLGLTNITINDIIIYALSRVLTMDEHRLLNSIVVDGNIIRTFTTVHVGVAVNTDRGLMVPTIFNADKLSLNEISLETKRLAKLCKESKITPDQLSNATITVSNLGSYGMESFTPIVNPPQVAIVGVNGIVTRVREKDGSIEAYNAMELSLSFDHRAVDGAPAAAFLKTLKETLESFTAVLAK